MEVADSHVYFYLFAYYVGTSVVSMLAMARDKLAARAQRQRISENNLHLLSAIGGWPGTWLACGLFLHKTQKSRFQVRLAMAASLNVGLLIVVLKIFTTYRI